MQPSSATAGRISKIPTQSVIYSFHRSDRRTGLRFKERPLINPRRITYFGTNLPASTLVEVSALVDPRMKVEIEAQAYVE